MNIWEDKMWGIMMGTALMKKYLNGRRQRKAASMTYVGFYKEMDKSHPNRFCKGP